MRWYTPSSSHWIFRPQRFKTSGYNFDASFNRHKGDKDADPSEVFWIGFPNYMNVDEMILINEFSPFGEIEHITTFPGHTYAFV